MSNKEKTQQQIKQEQRERLLDELEYYKEHNMIIDLDIKQIEYFQQKYYLFDIDNVSEKKLKDPFNNQNFMKGTHISSLCNLCKFDDKFIELVRPVVLNICFIFTGIMHYFLSLMLDFEEVEKEPMFFKNKTSFSNLLENKKTYSKFLYTFKDHKKSSKRKVLKFINYLMQNKESLATKTLEEFYQEFFDKFGITNFHKDFNKMFFIDSTKKPITKMDLLNKFIFEENGDLGYFSGIYNYFIIRDIKKLIISNLRENNLKKCRPYTKKPICEIFRALSFKQKVQIFDSLNKKYKHLIIDKLFEGLNLKWDKATKTNTFSAIMHIMPKVRRQVVHPRVLYHYDFNNKSAAKLIYDFIVLNDQNASNKISKNKLNWYSILWCIDLFQSGKLFLWHTKKILPATEKLFNKYIETDQKFPKEFKEYITNHFGFTKK